MKKVRIAICGAGSRGSQLTGDVLCLLDTVEVVAICDQFREKAEKLSDLVKEKMGNTPAVFTDYLQMLEQSGADAVLVATSFATHADISIAAMERGIAVGMEVGAASGEEECYRLIEAYERTKTPFMFLENCCYGKNELLAASLTKRGMLGDVVYCHGAYMHDCRELTCKGDGNGYNFRLEMMSNGDFYPTHELGPICKVLNVGRGNRMVSLCSRASISKGLSDYVSRKEEFADLRNHYFCRGDIIETLITCENGELINIRLDTSLPTYYSREITVRGTRGLFRQDGSIVMMDGEKYEWYDDAVGTAKKYEDLLPQEWKDIPQEALAAGHQGMDYLMLTSFVNALLAGKEMPVDVYDAVTWMCVGYLTEQSIAQGGASVEIPDFTKGAYKTRQPRDVVDL